MPGLYGRRCRPLHSTRVIILSYDGLQISNWIADGLAADGETEAAEGVRNAGDAVESFVGTAVDATACYGTVAAGAALGSVIPVFGTLAGAAAGAFLNPSCKEAVEGVVTTVGEAANAVDNIAAATCQPQCSGNTVPMCSTEVSCAAACRLLCRPAA